MVSLESFKEFDSSKKQYIADFLDGVVESLDLTETQYEQIAQAYRGVGTWLAGSDNPLLQDARIYAQGSVRLNTTVRPGEDEPFDIDLICYLPNGIQPSGVMLLDAVEQRLNQHARYRSMYQRLPRGFRVNYAADYHLDITPGVDYDSHIRLSGHPLWVTDRTSQWKESNSDGYARWFDSACQKRPLRRSHAYDRMRGTEALNESLAPLPDHTRKKLLNRIVQILKRHRDEWIRGQPKRFQDYKPISAIITTLSTHAYLKIIEEQRTYDNDLDVILDVVDLLPSFVNYTGGTYSVANPAMSQENFAEKWNIRENNKGAMLQSTFQNWQQAALASFYKIIAGAGQDKLMENVSESFGAAPVHAVRSRMNENMGFARRNGTLGVQNGTGTLITGFTAVGATSTQAQPVSRNTFYGSDSTAPASVPRNTFFGE